MLSKWVQLVAPTCVRQRAAIAAYAARVAAWILASGTGLPRLAACWAAAKSWSKARESRMSDAVIGVVPELATARCMVRRNRLGVTVAARSSATFQLKTKYGKVGRILVAPLVGSAW